MVLNILSCGFDRKFLGGSCRFKTAFLSLDSKNKLRNVGWNLCAYLGAANARLCRDWKIKAFNINRKESARPCKDNTTDLEIFHRL